jgi:uncharacterized protein with HEPN domain
MKVNEAAISIEIDSERIGTTARHLPEEARVEIEALAFKIWSIVRDIKLEEFRREIEIMKGLTTQDMNSHIRDV